LVPIPDLFLSSVEQLRRSAAAAGAIRIIAVALKERTSNAHTTLSWNLKNDATIKVEA
jgi:hypothetical protein